MALTQKQRLFVDAYIVSGNATEAAKTAGYSAKTAAEQGHQLLQNSSVAAEVEARQKQAADRADVDAARIRRELAAIAFSDLRDVAEWDDDGVTLKSSSEISDEAARSLREVVVRQEHVDGDRGSRTTKHITVKQHDKIRALELLGKDVGMFKDTLQLPGEIEVKLAFDPKGGA